MKAITNILFLSFWLLSFPVYSEAQQPFLLNIETVQEIQNGFIVVEVSKSDSAAIRIGSQKLISTLGSEGYFQASIDSIVAVNEMKIQMYFTKGPRSTYGEIKDESNQNHCNYLIGEFYSFMDLNGCMNSIVESLNQKGYPFATVSITQVEQSGEYRISVILKVLPGDYVSVLSYEFVGARNLDSRLLNSLSGWYGPAQFNPEIINESVSKLNRSEYISSANYSGLINSDSSYAAVFKVDEVRSSTIDLLLGLEPKLDVGYRLIGQGKLQLNHLFVPASRLNLNFNRSGTNESNLGLLYDQYQINQLPLGYGFGVELRQIDSTYLSIATMIATKWQIDYLKSLKLGFNYSKVTGSDNLQLLNQLSQNRYELSLGFSYQSINNWRVPTSGTVFNATLTTGYVNLIDDGLESNLPRGYSVNRFDMNYTRYLSLSRNLVMVPSQRLLHSVQDLYYDIDRIRFGGTNSMRGFREDQFRLAGYSLSTVEGRWMISSTSYLYTFVSGAYIWTPNELGVQNYDFVFDSKYSGGFGVSYRVRPGILNVSYAISNDDSWLNGKIHFGITNSF